jgi:hypothetical protein
MRIFPVNCFGAAARLRQKVSVAAAGGGNFAQRAEECSKTVHPVVAESS